ncbi:hypothetical protein M569_12627, partial [Genlisea aurea]
HVMEVAAGCDIQESVSDFATRRQRGVCILSGTGTVADVTIRRPEAPGAVLTLHGRFDILTLSGSFLPPPAPQSASALTIYIAGGQGRVMGGAVVGPLMTSGPVVLMAASFGNAAYERLPLEEAEEEEEEENRSGGGSGAGGLNRIGSPVGQWQDPRSSDPNANLLQNLLNSSSSSTTSSCQIPSEASSYWGRPAP